MNSEIGHIDTGLSWLLDTGLPKILCGRGQMLILIIL